ncbi:MAG: SLC13 family permease [Planctomycetes bacterium]|nr:SLC13 family permease [Planctomycetota bacterium]
MDGGIVIAITAASLVAFAFELLPMDIVAIGIVVSLIVTGVLPADQAVAGFGDRAVVAVGALLVISEGVLRTGALESLARRFATFGRIRPAFAFPLALAVVIVASAFLNNTPVVVLFLPVLLGLAREFRIFPSRVLIPLSYAAILGGTCTLIGTSTNIVASSIAERTGAPPIGMFELTPFGAIFAALGFLYLGLAYPKLLPDRKLVTTFLGPEGGREFVTEVEVKPESSLAGKRIADTALGKPGDLRAIQILRGEDVIWPPFGDEMVRAGDLVILRGAPNAILSLTATEGIRVLPEIAEGTLRFDRKRMRLLEIVVPPDSRWIGRPVRNVRFAKRFGVTVVAIFRHAHHIREKIAEVELRPTDILLAFSDEARIADLRESEEFVLLEGVHDLALNRAKAPLALAILAGVVAAIATGAVPLAGGALGGALLMVLAGCLTPREAYARVNWSILIAMGGTLALAAAYTRTGLADSIAREIVGIALPLGRTAVISSLYLLASVLTEIVSNVAAAALLIPIAVTAAPLCGTGTDPRAFVLAVAFGASASFATPNGYNTNALVYGAGGYRYADFLRAGLPLKLIGWAAATALLPILWP